MRVCQTGTPSFFEPLLCGKTQFNMFPLVLKRKALHKSMQSFALADAKLCDAYRKGLRRFTLMKEPTHAGE